MHQEIVLGSTAQAFYVEPIERPRRPASVVVKSSSGVIHAATTSCEIDPFETTLAEASPAGATMLRLKTTDGITIGTRYNIARHGVVVTAIDGDRITLRRPFALALAASTPFLGCRITAPIDPSWSAAAANVTEHLDVEAGYTLAWTYHTQAGAITTAHTTADLVHIPQSARVTPDDVERRFPGWLAHTERPLDTIAEAFEIVRRDAGVHRSIRRARDAIALRELAIIAAHVLSVEHEVMFKSAPYTTLTLAESRYRIRLDELVREAAEHRPRKPAPHVAAPDGPPPLSIAHANVIDAMMEWIGQHPLHSHPVFDQLTKEWLPRLRTRDERTVAAKLLRALSLPGKLRRRRDQLVSYLER